MEKIAALIRDALPEDVKDIDISLMPAGRPEWGDLSCAVALGLARHLRQSPQAIAQDVCNRLSGHEDIVCAHAVGGYINITLGNHMWHDVLRAILNQGTQYGHHDFGKGKSVNVEYVSANPTGPLHAAHARGAILGDALANLLASVGYDVVREYYINDAGQQIAVLGRTVLCHCQAIADCTTAIIPEGLYPGTYARDIAVSLMDQYPDYTALSFDFVCGFAVRILLSQIQDDLESVHLYHDLLTSERALQRTGIMDRMLAALRDKDLVYKGTLPPPKNAKGKPWQPEPLLLFKASNFGNEDDCALQNHQGQWTYFAGDLAYHWDKVQRGYNTIIDVWGADHASHVKRMQVALQALAGKSVDVAVVQMVHFSQEGKPLKMSKRAGTFVTLRDVLDMIDPDVLRFMMLTKKADTHLKLDIQEMKEQGKSNPIFYIQYAYARCCSVLRHAADCFGQEHVTADALKTSSFERLQDLSLAKVLADWPRQVQEAACSREPHRLTTYLYTVAQIFHGLWQKGNQDAGHRFIQSHDKHHSLALVALAQCAAFVIGSGLSILGIRPRKEL
jgi:arginyl-tRNA synthetase